ncbi:hypothetical protein ACQKMI_22515 [Lysinibacillus sp. NPDC097214]|uniref:hypothetical protein n=1 Tax=Lysinibacillus sp. NPDC097214 TaxID=3390584 RepID=UPI003CFCF465
MGQQMSFARKRSANAASATCFVCAKAKRQQQHDVGHSVVATGRGALRLSSSISAGVWTHAEK